MYKHTPHLCHPFLLDVHSRYDHVWLSLVQVTGAGHLIHENISLNKYVDTNCEVVNIIIKSKMRRICDMFPALHNQLKWKWSRIGNIMLSPYTVDNDRRLQLTRTFHSTYFIFLNSSPMIYILSLTCDICISRLLSSIKQIYISKWTSVHTSESDVSGLHRAQGMTKTHHVHFCPLSLSRCSYGGALGVFGSRVWKYPTHPGWESKALGTVWISRLL